MEQKSALHRLRKRIAVLDEQAAQELGKIDDEFEDEQEPAVDLPDDPKQAVPTGDEARPKALQSVVDQGGIQEEDETLPGGDKGPREGDII